MTALVRARTPSDIAECLEVLRQVQEAERYPFRWPPDPHRFVAPPYEETAWVAVGERHVIGHVALHDGAQDPGFSVAHAASGDESLVAVARLFTRIGHRGAGLGRRLLRTAVEAAHDVGQRPFLNVATHLHHAIGLYQEDWENLGPLTITFADGATLDVLVFLGPAPGRFRSQPAEGGLGLEDS